MSQFSNCTFERISWVEKQLWKWGDWTRNDLGVGGYASILGKLIKRKQLESGDSLDDVNDRDLLDEDEMLAIDQFIGTLPDDRQLLCKLRYKAERSDIEIGKRIGRHRNTVRKYFEEMLKDIEPDLRARLDGV